MASPEDLGAIPPFQEETISNTVEEYKDVVEYNSEREPSSLSKEEKSSDSDVNSEETNTNDEQIDIKVNSNSQFYEISDSKIDYAVKLDDNDTLSDIEDIKTDSGSADSEDSALGSLPPDREEEPHDRCDNSDSGLGSEAPDFTLTLDLPCTSGLSYPEPTNADVNIENTSDENPASNEIVEFSKPLRSNLKRKCDDEATEEPQVKKKKEGIRFDKVTVYYFPRAQGFSCVPSQGGSTLGMEWEHTHTDNFTLTEHAAEQRRLHRQILQQLKNERHSLQGATFSSSEDSDTEEEASDISESELDLDSYYFLQPVPTRQRRALLRAAGVRKIEGYEKDECRDIRSSREFCGCACKGLCKPESCSCSLAGIKCQVDRLNFPCGCTRDGCANTTGRIEFNPVRVRTHFIHTLMRVGLEKKNEEEAAKRQWALIHGLRAPYAPPAPCAPPALIAPPAPPPPQDDGLLRDVSLTPRVEVESCVNAGSFSNVHCAINNAGQSAQSNNVRVGANYTYTDNSSIHNNINENNTLHMVETSHHNGHAEPYTSSILQGKGPPYTLSTNVAFDNMQHNVQRFPCDLNYSYPQQTANHDYKNPQSFSASSFEEFAHNSHMSMFSHYGHMYAPEYLHKQNANVHDHSTLQYHPMPQNHYEMYKNTTDASAQIKPDQHHHYTSLMSMPYHTNKIQTVENDENWFSHNSLLSLEASDSASAADAPAPVAEAPATADSDALEPTENFGELIKKTMVESVLV